MSSSGCASTQGTENYRRRFRNVAADNYFREAQGLWFSSIGIGTYLGNASAETDRAYRDAIVRAVELGANVIDTAANYRFQRSERSVGAAIAELERRGLGRDEMTVCTKGGYIPFDGEPPRDVRHYIEENFIETGIAGWGDIAAGVHCMTPRYLDNQLRQSLSNLKLDCVDVYYVHNPESQLSAVSHDEFWRRVRAAFEFLEQSVSDGRIEYYGVATWNGFREEPDSRGYHSLETMVELARATAGDDHHFRFIQLPVNLTMPEALFFQNQKLGDEYVSVVEAADKFGVTVMASGSLMQGQVAHGLPESIRQTLGSLATDAQTGIQFVRSSPGITTALVGMSKIAHVEENLALANVDPVSPDALLGVYDHEE
ncbi:MAG TPA: aldo/keto reductase [Pyrinomonadaceae bacterium]|jgi:aryl-alcohol dehydrogenase-like predicted oxidoreductase|nr:aldo/keto reductase [Pyrinomonadaceae bacterium]